MSHIKSKIMNEFNDFATRIKNGDTVKRVLDIAPGHGKSQTLNDFLANELQNKDSNSAYLIVLREVSMLEEVEKIIKSKGLENIIYLDAKNTSNRIQIASQKRVLLITHKRFQDIVQSMETKHERNKNYLYHKSLNNAEIKRTIIIDELPQTFDGVFFEMNGDESNWVPKLIRELNLEARGKHEVDKVKLHMVKNITSILLMNEALSIKKSKTKKLSKRIRNTDWLNEMENFFKLIDEKIEIYPKSQEIKSYKAFKKMFYEDNIGIKLSSSNPMDIPTLFCVEKIKYHNLENSILILDATAKFHRAIYGQHYEISDPLNYHNYRRVTIHHRVISTSEGFSSKDNTQFNKNLEAIWNDIEKIQKKEYIFPIVKKKLIKPLLQRNLLGKEDEKLYLNAEDNIELPLNLFNLTGKNTLREKTACYIVSLPIKHINYYRMLALSVFDDTSNFDLSKKYNDPSLDIIKEQIEIPIETKEGRELNTVENNRRSSLVPNSISDSKRWFQNQQLNDLYENMLLSEIYQVIHRINIRELESTKPVNIYMSNNHLEFMKLVYDTLPKVNHHTQRLKNTNKVERRFDEIVSNISKAIEQNHCTLPLSMGRIIGHTDKTYLNRHWKNDDTRELIKTIFHQYNFRIDEDSQNSFKVIDFLNRDN
ncbi:hypothetical protein [Paenisporosarcina sp. TG20]|uniref:hypothetical protein n=1 Tax=Paenisporosarcina sp. TG20 TaxID=1211706 RepID=UPI0002D48033|nr:hypothetical protein [Paenisporosarcina sp. TG20]